MIRVAEANAKMHLRDFVTEDDVNMAIRLATILSKLPMNTYWMYIFRNGAPPPAPPGGAPGGGGPPVPTLHQQFSRSAHCGN